MSHRAVRLPIPANKPTEELMFPYDSIEHNLSHILGRVLTIVDSVVPPGQQNKATKDLIKDVFRSQASWMASNANVQRTVMLNVEGVSV